MSGLPDNWREFKLGDVLDRSKETVMPRDLNEERVGLVGLEDIEGGGTGVIRIVPTTPQFIDSLKTRFQTGDILYGKLRPYLNKVAIAPTHGICSTEIWALRPKSICHPVFAAAFLSSNLFVDRVASLTKGANLPRLDASSFDSIAIPLPPLSEQHRIVEILQEAEKIRRLRAAAEAKAAEIVPALFSEIFLSTNGSFEECDFIPLGNLLSEIQTGWSPVAGDHRMSEEEWAILKLGAVSFGTYNDSENKALLSDSTPKPDLEVQSGDLLLVRKNTRDLVGVATYVWETAPRLMFPDLVFRLRLRSNAPVSNQYLWALFSHPSFRRRIAHLADGAAASMVNIPKSRLNSLSIPVPPSSRLQKFYETLAQFREVGNIVAFDSSKLIFSLTANAFSGELTRSWRETHHKKLALEARERDAALAASGAELPRGRRATIPELASIFEDLPTDGQYADLSREQRDLFKRIRKMVGGVKHLRYFTAEAVANEINEGPLHRNPRAIEAHLAVFAVRGLVIPVSRRHPDSVRTSYALAYRLPVENLDNENGEPDDDCRQEMMTQQFRLATGDI